MVTDEDQQPKLASVSAEPSAVCDSASLRQLLEPLVRQQRDTADKLATLTSHIDRLDRQVRSSLSGGSTWQNFGERDVAILLIAIFLQMFFVWLLK